MSHIQSRGEKYEGHVRKAGRSGGSGYHRGFSGGVGGGKVGVSYGPPAPSSASSHDPSQNPSLSASRSFKKTGGGNGQGGQIRMPPARINSEGGGAASVMMYRPVQNGTHMQAPSPGNPNVPMNCISQSTDPSSSKVPRDLPKPPQLSKGGSDSMSPATPMKGETPGSFMLQFGSISPGVVNGIQIPVRTSSAPPNLDEQKHDQVARESFVPVPSREQPPPQPPQKRVMLDSSQPSTGPSQLPSAAKREGSSQIPASAPISAPKQSIPISGMSMPLFQHPQAPAQFGGHNSQIHSQSIAPGPLSMSMVPIPLGPGHPMIVAGLQSHAMHQSQGLNFAGPMNHPISPQIGNMSMGIGAQYGQPHGNFGAPRKSAVKITHPETHEELKLGKTAGSSMDSSGPRSHGSMPGKPQQIPTFSNPHQTGYFQSNQYAPTSVYTAPSSAPSIGTQTTRPQVQQYNFPFGLSGHPVSIANPPARPSAMITKSETLVQSIPEQPNLDDGQTIPVVPTIEENLKNISLGKDVTKLIDTHEESAATNIQKINTTDSDGAVDQNKSITEVPGNFISVKGTMVPTQKTEVGSCLLTPVTSALDSGDSSSSADIKKMEHTEKVDSVKVNNKKASKEDNQLIEQVHKVHVSERTSRIDSQSSSPVEDHDVSSEVRMQVPPESGPSDLQEGHDVPVLLASPGDSGNQETVQDISVLKSTPATITTDNLVQKGPEHSSSVATHVHIHSNVCNNVEASGLKEEGSTQLKVEIKQNSNEVKESDKASASDDSSTGIDNAKIHPVSSATESSMDVHKIKNSPESTTIPEDVATCKSNNVNMEHISANEEKTSLSSAFSGPHVSEEGEAITQDADVAVADNLFKGDTVAASVSALTSTSKDQQLPEMSLARTVAGQKKKMRELLSKADAAGTNFDLYMAYKRPDEKSETKTSSESTDSSAVIVNWVSEGRSEKLVVAMEKEGQNKIEIDDWEDAADISTPNLKMSYGSQQHHGSQKLDNESKSGSMTKKYTRDFLLTISEQCTDLPADFENGPDLPNALISVRKDSSFPSHARIIDRPGGPSRVDRHSVNAFDDDRWSKSNSFSSVRDLRMDGHGPSRQGSNNGILRSRGGILPGPGPLPQVAHGVISRNNIDSDRWQRASGSQRGLVPSPHMPAQIMHKAENRYEIGKMSGEEEAKQRQIKSILNKLTPQNFDRLFEKVKEVGIDSADTLTGVISQIFDKALMEPTFCEMYADFCFHLSGALPGFSEKDEKITFKRLLLNKCQEEFEREEREEAEAGKFEEEGEIMQTPQEREEKRLKARRRMLGNIRLIGELYKKKMLTERIMHECIKKLLGQHQKPDEEDIEALCKLMSTIGEMIDHSKAKEHMDVYFDMMKTLSTNQTLSSRVRFMLRDAIDLRKNNWQQRRKVEGPKKIEEVHRDAAQERVQTSRSVRGSGIVSSARRGPPSDYGHRSSASLFSQSSQQFRAFPPQARGFGAQDVRMEDRHPTENRMSMPLPQRQRAVHDDTITLGPQGGLARDMSLRGQPLVQNAPLADYTRESRRTGSGPNGKSSASTWTSSSSKEEVMARASSDRFSSAPYDYSISHERSPNLSNGDFRKADVLERSIPSTCPHDHLASSMGNVSETMSNERLREKSISTIREYYSAKDEKEVVLCIEELNSPGFYPSMVSLWVTDSFERKDVERDLLAKLLISLSKSQHRILSQAQLIKGFEEVLLNLEDAVNDAPRAAEFLGRIFAKIILEDVISFGEVGRMIREGGEEPGCLVEFGLASDVLGSILEIIKSEQGDAVLEHIKLSSSLRLEDFRPPHGTKSRKLDAFL